jgi:hypothetical protein
MAARAANNGMTQEVSGRSLTWLAGGRPAARYVFIDDPSDFDAVRRVYEDESNARVPVCFVIVKQPDESETRGDVVFDIFRLSPRSYLWHFFRVYTPPRGGVRGEAAEAGGPAGSPAASD